MEPFNKLTFVSFEQCGEHGSLSNLHIPGHDNSPKGLSNLITLCQKKIVSDLLGILMPMTILWGKIPIGFSF